MNGPFPRVIEVIVSEEQKGHGTSQRNVWHLTHAKSGKPIATSDPLIASTRRVQEGDAQATLESHGHVVRGLRIAINAGKLKRCSADTQRYLEQLLTRAEGGR